LTLEHTTTHVSDALALLVEQFRGKAQLEALLASYVRQVQLLEDAAQELLTGRWIDNAEGELLDFLGRLVGVERLALSDDLYRTLIRAQIRLLVASATGDDIISIMETATRNVEVELTGRYPAAQVVELVGELIDNLGLVSRLLHTARGAGINTQLVYSLSPTSEMFTFASGVVPEAATNGWADAAQTTGGRLAGVIA